MRNVLVIGSLLLASGCAMQPMAKPTQVTWVYGMGNGDPVAYQGTRPTFARTYGAGNGDPVSNGVKASNGYSYGGDGGTGSSVMFAPPVAAPPK